MRAPWPTTRAATGLRVVTVGEAADADVRADRPGLRRARPHASRRCEATRCSARVDLRIPGRHYVVDALAALVAGLELGHGFDGLREGLEAFAGSGRRMEAKGHAGGVRVYDSYAHHPAEIAADLEAARAVAGEGRLVVAFQPHLVSRTREFGPAMGAALGAADEVVVLDVYAARESPDPAVTGRLVVGRRTPARRRGSSFVAGLDEAAAELAARARDGDLVLTLGAGSVTEVGPLVLEILAADG